MVAVCSRLDHPKLFILSLNDDDAMIAARVEMPGRQSGGRFQALRFEQDVGGGVLVKCRSRKGAAYECGAWSLVSICGAVRADWRWVCRQLAGYKDTL